MKSGRLWYPILLTVLGTTCSACRSPYFADQGAMLGGAAGALTGAALGDQSGHAAGGALVGGAMGALTGAAIGDSMDAELDRRQAVTQRQQQLAKAVSVADVTTMTASGLGEDVIVNYIYANGVRGSLSAGEIIQLHDSGVSEHVINAMQQQASRQATPPVVAGPVIVEESYVAPPFWGPPPHRHYCAPPRYYRRQPGWSWGVSYSKGR